jgi:hypothetical protein
MLLAILNNNTQTVRIESLRKSSIGKGEEMLVGIEPAV